LRRSWLIMRGLGDRDRMTVYYTALLVNVRCHADAHEQAKWSGDDISLKSGKHVHELRSPARCAGHPCGRPRPITSSTSTPRSDASNRAAAAMFAVQHGLPSEETITTTAAL
jgi:hypothetical protein